MSSFGGRDQHLSHVTAVVHYCTIDAASGVHECSAVLSIAATCFSMMPCRRLNRLEDAGCEAICDVIPTNTSLEQLSLGANGMGLQVSSELDGHCTLRDGQ